MMLLKQLFSFLLRAELCTLVLGSHSCADWEPYLDEKCFKVFTGLPFQNFTAAEATCGAQDGAKLLTIGSPEEQAFIEEYLFTSKKVVDSVWLGARFQNGKFRWQDGQSTLTYSNWAAGSPKNQENYCVMMNPQDEAKGKWTDESCERKNLVACQREPTLSLQELKGMFYQLRKEYQKTVKKQTAENLKLETQLADLKQHSIPLGFTYVQLPKEKPPSDIWPSMTWSEVSATYEGVFFRVAGGGAADFGTLQKESSPKLEQVEEHECPSYPINKCQGIPYAVSSLIPSDGTWSDYVLTTGDYINDIVGIGDESKRLMKRNFHRFRHSTGEVRPKNMAIKIWKRTA